MRSDGRGLILKLTILETLRRLHDASVAKLPKGNAPTIMNGPYAGEIVTSDHIIPWSVIPELDKVLFALIDLVHPRKRPAEFTRLGF